MGRERRVDTPAANRRHGRRIQRIALSGALEARQTHFSGLDVAGAWRRDANALPRVYHLAARVPTAIG